MKKLLLILALLLPTFFADAKPRFELPCRVTKYVDNKEVSAVHPTVKTYTLVKEPILNTNPQPGQPKWNNENYFIEMLMNDGSLKKLVLVPAYSGDEDYDEYHVADDQESDSITFWLSSGSIQYQFEWGNFQGSDAKGDTIFYACE